MICEAIGDLKGTVSRPAISKWIKEHYSVNDVTLNLHIKNGITKALQEGKIVQVKASYKLKKESLKESKDEGAVKAKVVKRKGSKAEVANEAKKKRVEKEGDAASTSEESQERR